MSGKHRYYRTTCSDPKYTSQQSQVVRVLSEADERFLLRKGGYFILEGNLNVSPATMKAPLPR